MRKFIHHYSYTSVLLILFLTACGQSDDQREFERMAYSIADGYTQTNSSGEIVDGNEDPDDWQVAPFFIGQVSVYPAHPNPVLTNNRVNIDLFINSIDAASGLIIIAYYENGVRRFLFEDTRQPLPPGLIHVSINPLEIAYNQSNPQGLYRIIVLDRNENVITYGDVKIE